jgi:hypothetical protein
MFRFPFSGRLALLEERVAKLEASHRGPVAVEPAPVDDDGDLVFACDKCDKLGASMESGLCGKCERR